MTIAVTHSTPADSSFSSTGAAAWNADHTLTGVGTIAEQDANAVAITGGSINGTTVGSTTPAAGTFTTLTATGQTSLGGVAGSESLRVAPVASAVNWLEIAGATSGSATPTFTATGTNSNISIRYQAKGTGVHRFDTAGTVRQFQISDTASAVNYVQVTGSATLTGGPTVSAQGSDFNIPLRLSSKGISAVELGNPAGWAGFTVTTTNNPNRIALNAPATGFIPTFSTAGVDTNAGMAFISKGTGAIDLAAGSSGVNISNGGTVTAITRTNAGTSYTSVPTVAISAPTTAGGVQATATVSMGVNTFAVASGGTGYTVGNTLTVVGGTGTAVVVTVSAVSAGVVTAVTYSSGGSYTVTPTNPAATTGGTGSGCTLNITYTINNSFTITNAGSGYVEQPTVSFSGGGGSGASAYAVVGATSVLRNLSNTLQFQTPGGTQFAVSDSAATSNAYWQAVGGAGTADLRTAGGSVSSGAFSTQTAIPLVFRTNFTEQLRVAHTASAVNYVQVTGAATGSGVAISAQGSDAAVGLFLSSKGAGNLNFQVAGALRQRINGADGTVDSGISASGGIAFKATPTGSQVNYLQAAGGAAGSAPVFSAQGSDTNIDLTLTPKGTGNVRFGTYTATISMVTGYIEIKDSGGTVRRLAVVA